MVLQQILESMGPLFSSPHRGLMVHSAILWGLGDVAAQAITHYNSVSDRCAKKSEDKDEEFISFKKIKIDWFRVYSASGFGAAACIGPAAYYRYINMHEGIQPSAQLVLEGLFGTIGVAAFFPHMGFFGALSRAPFPYDRFWHGSNWSVEQTKEFLKRGFAPALVMGGVMVPATMFTISRFVPAPYQLHCASLFALVSSCALSWIEVQQQRDDDAASPEDERSKV